MIDIKQGSILLVLTENEAELIIDGLDEIIYGEKRTYNDESVISAVNLANYIEERLNEVENREIL